MGLWEDGIIKIMKYIIKLPGRSAINQGTRTSISKSSEAVIAAHSAMAISTITVIFPDKISQTLPDETYAAPTLPGFPGGPLSLGLLTNMLVSDVFSRGRVSPCRMIDVRPRLAVQCREPREPQGNGADNVLQIN